MDKRVTILLSGGVDSAVLLFDTLNRGICVDVVFVDYGQPARPFEEYAAEEIWGAACDRFPDLCGDLLYADVSLDSPDMHTAPGVPGPRIVPHRNLIMLALAMNMTRNQTIMFGATAADAVYPDCSEDFAIAAGFALDCRVLVPLATLERTSSRKRSAWTSRWECVGRATPR